MAEVMEDAVVNSVYLATLATVIRGDRSIPANARSIAEKVHRHPFLSRNRPSLDSIEKLVGGWIKAGKYRGLWIKNDRMKTDIHGDTYRTSSQTGQYSPRSGRSKPLDSN